MKSETKAVVRRLFWGLNWKNWITGRIIRKIEAITLTQTVLEQPSLVLAKKI